MGRGRKLTTSRSERYLGSYGNGDSHGTVVTDETELEEDDIWSAIENDAATERSSGLDYYGACRPRAAVSRNGRLGGLSLAFEDSSAASSRIVHQIRANENGDNGGATGGGGGGGNGRHLATSAPVSVPDWSKIYRVNSVESMHESEDEDGEEGRMVPPHEYLARSQARRSRKKGGGGASILEGVGRTLKGRDLRRVRDAVWSQTGFYG